MVEIGVFPPDIIEDLLIIHGGMIEYLMDGLMIGGAFIPPDVFADSQIIIWSRGTIYDVDQRVLRNVIRVIDHEYMHLILFMLEGWWETVLFDNIYWNIEFWFW